MRKFLYRNNNKKLYLHQFYAKNLVSASKNASWKIKIVFTEKIDSNEYSIIPGMSVVPRVKVK